MLVRTCPRWGRSAKIRHQRAAGYDHESAIGARVELPRAGPRCSRRIVNTKTARYQETNGARPREDVIESNRVQLPRVELPRAERRCSRRAAQRRARAYEDGSGRGED